MTQQDKQIPADQSEQRSLGTDLAQAAVGGATGGAAGVVTAWALGKLGGGNSQSGDSGSNQPDDAPSKDD